MDLNEINTLFEQEDKKYVDGSVYRGTDDIVEDAEEEYRSLSVEQKSREDEKTQIKKEITLLRAQLKKNKNINNHRMRNVNEQRSKKRKEINRKIAEHLLRLEEIKQEEIGYNDTQTST